MPPTFRTVVADPPWEYPTDAPFVGGTWTGSVGTRNKYPTLPLEDICEFPLRRFVAETAYLWLWIPVCQHELGWHREVAYAWDFPHWRALRYWRKTSAGTGHWVRHRIEFLILFTRGPKPSIDYVQGLDQEIPARVLTHSGKPEAAYRDVERVCPGPYLELFARDIRPNQYDALHEWSDWTVWGKEIGDPLGVGFDPAHWRELRRAG